MYHPSAGAGTCRLEDYGPRWVRPSRNYWAELIRIGFYGERRHLGKSALMYMQASRTSLLLHIIVETVAGLSFVTTPQKQLPGASIPAELILRCYGGCILSNVCIALVFYCRQHWDETSRRICLAFALWHVWPVYRAVMRIMWCPEVDPEALFGGPFVHIGIHVLLFCAFLKAARVDDVSRSQDARIEPM